VCLVGVVLGLCVGRELTAHMLPCLIMRLLSYRIWCQQGKMLKVIWCWCADSPVQDSYTLTNMLSVPCAEQAPTHEHAVCSCCSRVLLVYMLCCLTCGVSPFAHHNCALRHTMGPRPCYKTQDQQGTPLTPQQHMPWFVAGPSLARQQMRACRLHFPGAVLLLWGGLAVPCRSLGLVERCTLPALCDLLLWSIKMVSKGGLGLGQGVQVGWRDLGPVRVWSTRVCGVPGFDFVCRLCTPTGCSWRQRVMQAVAVLAFAPRNACRHSRPWSRAAAAVGIITTSSCWYTVCTASKGGSSTHNRANAEQGGACERWCFC
jgi:hypothetical protein